MLIYQHAIMLPTFVNSSVQVQRRRFIYYRCISHCLHVQLTALKVSLRAVVAAMQSIAAISHAAKTTPSATHYTHRVRSRHSLAMTPTVSKN